MSEHSPDAILDFWFSDTVKAAWFERSDSVDRAIAERFTSVYESARDKKLQHWRAEPESTLALTIALDQFPRNLFRQSAQAFATDAQAVSTAQHAIAQGHDQKLPEEQRTFFYLPLMHSETLAEQRQCVALYQALGDEYSLGFAREHHDIVERFGRFPHRNAVLGRSSTPEELEFLKHHSGF